MRITSGSARGRRVPLPRGVDLRPTSDKVKQALFNVLAPLVPGAAVLDLFCGSGNLGLEALSRGARSAFFVDRQRRCVESARAAAETFGFAGSCQWLCADWEQALGRLAGGEQRFDLVFLDPPYQSGLGIRALQNPDLVAIVAPGSASRVVLEHDASQPPPILSAFQPEKTRAHGGTALTFFCPALSAPAPKVPHAD